MSLGGSGRIGMLVYSTQRNLQAALSFRCESGREYWLIADVMWLFCCGRDEALLRREGHEDAGYMYVYFTVVFLIPLRLNNDEAMLNTRMSQA